MFIECMRTCGIAIIINFDLGVVIWGAKVLCGCHDLGVMGDWGINCTPFFNSDVCSVLSFSLSVISARFVQ